MFISEPLFRIVIRWAQGSIHHSRTNSESSPATTSVTGILVPVISVLGTNFFVENFGLPGPVFLIIMVRSGNFGPPSHSIVMIYTKSFYLHAIKFN